MKKIIIMIGLPTSGKSSFIKKNLSHIETISFDKTLLNYFKNLTYNDAIKLYMNDFQVQKKLKDKINHTFHLSLSKGINLIIDFTNLTKEERNRWIIPSQKYNYQVIGIYLNIDKKIFCYRNNIRKKKENKEIPLNVYSSMIEKFEIPTLKEFDIFIILKTF